MENLLIVVEGPDAVGKDTLTRGLCAKLGATRFSFPRYESPTGKLILQHLKREWACDRRWLTVGPLADSDPDQAVRDATVRQSLMTLNRVEAQVEIMEALDRGPVVIDRWYPSSLAYGVAEGLDEAWLRSISSCLFEPDVLLYLECPAEVALARRPPRDANESDRALMDRVRREYARLLQPEPHGPNGYSAALPTLAGAMLGNWDSFAWSIDATRPVAEVLSIAECCVSLSDQ